MPLRAKLLLNIALSALVLAFAHPLLEEALVNDMLPPSSRLCVGSGQTNFSFEFSWTNETSKWHSISAPFEVAPELSPQTLNSEFQPPRTRRPEPQNLDKP